MLWDSENQDFISSRYSIFMLFALYYQDFSRTVLQDRGWCVGILGHTSHGMPVFIRYVFHEKYCLIYLSGRRGSIFTSCNKIQGPSITLTSLCFHPVNKCWAVRGHPGVRFFLDNALWRGNWSAAGGCWELALCFSLLEWVLRQSCFLERHAGVQKSAACVLLRSPVLQDCS